VGFSKEVSVKELSELKAKHGIPIFEDLGSGTLVDFSKYGLFHEPTVQEALAAGADIVSFSGDKLLGGPQAGIIVGRKEFVEKIKKNPLNRAIRIDKLTLAAMEGVFRLYLNEENAVKTIPTLRMLTSSREEIKKRAKKILNALRRLRLTGLNISLQETISRVGGGALPLEQLKSYAVAIKPDEAFQSVSFMEKLLREQDPPVIVRIENDIILMDARTIFDSDIKIIAKALHSVHDVVTAGK
jgi:L-seryl-tRNA(Ser) seleniumtransferase